MKLIVSAFLLPFLSANVIQTREEANSILRIKRAIVGNYIQPEIYKMYSEDSLEKWQSASIKLELKTDEDWSKFSSTMYNDDMVLNEMQYHALQKCIKRCRKADFWADIKGHGFEEQKEKFSDGRNQVKPKNMCLNCFEKVPTEKWVETTTAKTTTTTTTTTTEVTTTTEDKTTAALSTIVEVEDDMVSKETESMFKKDDDSTDSVAAATQSAGTTITTDGGTIWSF